MGQGKTREKATAKTDRKLFQFNREPNLAEEENVPFEINLNGNEEWKIFDNEKLENNEEQIKSCKVFELKCCWKSAFWKGFSGVD